MFGRIFGLDGRESYRELRLEPLSSGPVAVHPMQSDATATSDVELDRQCHPVDEWR
jgi:hypothetical protein